VAKRQCCLRVLENRHIHQVSTIKPQLLTFCSADNKCTSSEKLSWQRATPQNLTPQSCVGCLSGRALEKITGRRERLSLCLVLIQTNSMTLLQPKVSHHWTSACLHSYGHQQYLKDFPVQCLSNKIQDHFNKQDLGAAQPFNHWAIPCTHCACDIGPNQSNPWNLCRSA
jgi:hypothetical protein